MALVTSLNCPTCGAPLPAAVTSAPTTCAYCSATVVPTGGRMPSAALFDEALRATELPRVPGEVRVTIRAVPYRLLGRLAHGAASDVFLAERARTISERVIVKIVRRKEDEPRLTNEWDHLVRFSKEVPRLASPVASGIARDGQGFEAAATVVQAKSGFTHTLEQLGALFPAGLDPRHAVWIWRRLLDLLAAIHDRGFGHGAIDRSHVLLHARDHGATLVGWSRAGRLGAPLFDSAAIHSRELDLALLAQSITASILRTSRAPAPLGELLSLYGEGDPAHFPTCDARELSSLVRDRARIAYGPPSYLPLVFPSS